MAKVIYKATFIDDDGKTFIKEVEADVPSGNDYNFRDRNSFLSTFDIYEKATIDVTNKLKGEVTKELLDRSVKKKNRKKT